MPGSKHKRDDKGRGDNGKSTVPIANGTLSQKPNGRIGSGIGLFSNEEESMKKFISVVFVVLIIGIIVTPAICGASEQSGPAGPAPNSGDGVPDGSGFDGSNGPNGNSGDPGTGPAPNSGDGISDGSGMDSPNGSGGK